MRLAIAASILCLAYAPPARAPIHPAAEGATPAFQMLQDLHVAGAVASAPICAADLLHPVDLTVQLEDAMAPGQWLRATVAVTSRVDLTDVRVELLPVPAVELAGNRKMTLARIAAGAREDIGFLVRVPDTQAPLQVQVRVVGHVDAGILERGTVLHLLPRGPEHPGVESAVPSSEHRVLEYRGAGRRVP